MTPPHTTRFEDLSLSRDAAPTLFVWPSFRNGRNSRICASITLNQNGAAPFSHVLARNDLEQKASQPFFSIADVEEGNYGANVAQLARTWLRSTFSEP